MPISFLLPFLKAYNRSHMQPDFHSAIPDASLAVFPVNGENSHQGFEERNPAPYPVREACNFTVLLGMRGQAELNRIESRCTGKERDTESGLDYFGARYYSSSMGRWMSPDWSAKEEPVPYAKLDDPQSLNLYGYVRNNPLSMADPDGHEGCCDLLPSQAEVDAALAGIAAASSGGGGLLSAAARFVPWLAGPAIIRGAMVHPVTVGQSDANEIAQRDANLRQNQEHQETSPEPQTSTSGSGARQGGGKMTDHGQQRADEAKSGDTHRQVGDANKVVSGGKSYTDADTGNTVHVSGNRVVITNAQGERVTQFKNSKSNTQQRIKDGKWVPN